MLLGQGVPTAVRSSQKQKLSSKFHSWRTKCPESKIQLNLDHYKRTWGRSLISYSCPQFTRSSYLYGCTDPQTEPVSSTGLVEAKTRQCLFLKDFHQVIHTCKSKNQASLLCCSPCSMLPWRKMQSPIAFLSEKYLFQRAVSSLVGITADF